jgi:hypothetical protein
LETVEARREALEGDVDCSQFAWGGKPEPQRQKDTKKNAANQTS